MLKRALMLLLISVPLGAEPQTYPAALAAYQKGDLAVAERQFRAVIEQGEAAPATLKASYFLARTLMKQRKFEEASSVLIQIHRLSPAFYREWACDYLLGVCREALGRD